MRPIYGYGYPQDDNITASATVRPVGGELLFDRFLVYHSSAAESAISVHDHDSAVPFEIRGNSSAPVKVTVVDSNGNARAFNSSGGNFNFIHVDTTTTGKAIGNPVTVKVKVETLQGRLLANAEATDTVVGEELKIGDELVRLKPKALELVQSQAQQ